MTNTTDLMALDLECRLTIGHRIHCECASYFAARREVLLPEVMKEAERSGRDPVDLFALYAHKVHARHLAGNPLDFGSAVA